LSPNTSSDLPKLSTGRTIELLFGLTPSGVYRATIVTNRAVRSYRTFSPLPFTGGLFSVALSVGLNTPQALPGALPYGARTFLPHLNMI